MRFLSFALTLVLCVAVFLAATNSAQQLPKVEQVELQPLTAQVRRLIEATDYLGAPLAVADKQALERASNLTDAVRARREIQDCRTHELSRSRAFS